MYRYNIPNSQNILRMCELTKEQLRRLEIQHIWNDNRRGRAVKNAYWVLTQRDQGAALQSL